MEIEYNNIYLHIKRRPSNKYIMVAIPLYMYRIETNEFEHGLNFFQKLVLMFKTKPGIKDETISTYTGLDPRLISIVTSELRYKFNLINEHGALSENGKDKLNEVNGLLINSGKRKIGYVFKYLNEDKLYPYFIQRIEPADIILEKDIHPKIVTGTKGEGEDFTEIPFFLDELILERQIFNKPTEREVLQLIQNSNRKCKQESEDEEKNNKLSKQLSIRFLNEHPEIIWVCSYIYLKQMDDGYFDPEWRIADPFGFGDSIFLKFYISKLRNKSLNQNIISKFSDAKTLNYKTVSDYNEIIEKQKNEKLLSDFSISFMVLEKNLQIYIESVVKNLILLELSNYNDPDATLSFSINIQNAFENIFKQDKEQRRPVYERVFSEIDNDFERKKRILINIYRQKLFSNNIQVPMPLINACKKKLEWGNSLLYYLVSFILTYKYDNKSALFGLLKNRIELIIEISHLRNEKGHGQISLEKELKPLSKENALKYYDSFKSIINNYVEAK